MGLFRSSHSEADKCAQEFGKGRQEGRSGKGRLELTLSETVGTIVPGQTKQHKSRMSGLEQGLQERSESSGGGGGGSASSPILWVLVVLFFPVLLLGAAFVLPLYMLKWMTVGRKDSSASEEQSRTGFFARLGMGWLGLFFLVLALSLLGIMLRGVPQELSTLENFNYHSATFDQWWQNVIGQVAALIASMLWIPIILLMGLKFIFVGRFFAKARMVRA